jgi:hypothetical protein
MRALLLAMAAAVSSPFADAAPRFSSGRELAAAMVGPLGMEVRECDAALEAKLRPDLEVTCAQASGSLGSFKKALSGVLQGPAFAAYPWLAVSEWSAAEPESDWVRICYWLGASSFEAWFDNKTSEVLLITSKPYPRCGPDVPFHPPGMGDGKNSTLVSSLVPTGYPLEAAKDKIDGSAALEVGHVAGKPSVLCIHHATPQGLGFEFFAIEAVHTTIDLAFVEPENPDEHSTVIVPYSKADERPKPDGVQYHH